MALTNTTEGTNSKYINLKITRTIDTDKPAFVLQEDFKNTATSYKEVKGLLKSISSSFTPKGGNNKYDTYGAKIQLTDGEEIYSIDTTITNGSKDLLNGLLSVKVGEEVTLYVWENKGWYQTGGAIKDSNATDKEDKFYKSFFEWNEDYKNNFKSLIYNELDGRVTPEQEAKEDISLDSIPF